MDNRGCIFLYFAYLFVFSLGFLGVFLMVDAFCPRSEPVPAGRLVVEFIIGALLLIVAIFLRRLVVKKHRAETGE